MLACTVAARRLGIAPPVLLLACGALLGFVPALRAVSLPPQAVIARMRTEYDEHLQVLRADGNGDADNRTRRAEADYAALRLELLARKRATIVRLRDERRIDDTVLRQIQLKLDVEEVRLSRRDVAD